MANAIKKVLLINPPWYRLFGGKLDSPPLGLCYIAGALEKNNYDVAVYNSDHDSEFKRISERDMTSNYNKYLDIIKDDSNPIWKEIRETISEQSPDVVGISVTTAKYGSALNISNIVKQTEDIPVIWGGIHPTVMADQILKNPSVDMIIRGEGELAFLDLIKNLNEPENIKGISYKENNKIIHNEDRELIDNLDELPFPAKHLILDLDTHDTDSFGNIITSRGCPYNCIFCASHKIWTRKVRYRSPENVIEEIKSVNKAFGTDRFRFEDDSFTLNRNFVEEICEKLIQLQPGINWSTETRVNLINDGLIKKMKSAGCTEITIGVESGDDLTLKKIKKGITVSQVMEAKKVLRKNRMKYSAFFMIGFPWEGPDEINKTVSVMKELSPHKAILSIATPYPGTELYDIALEAESIKPENIDWNSFFHQSPGMDISEKLSHEEKLRIIDDVENIFVKHNQRKALEDIITDPERLYKLVKRYKLYNPKNLIQILNRGS